MRLVGTYINKRNESFRKMRMYLQQIKITFKHTQTKEMKICEKAAKLSGQNVCRPRLFLGSGRKSCRCGPSPVMIPKEQTGYRRSPAVQSPESTGGWHHRRNLQYKSQSQNPPSANQTRKTKFLKLGNKRVKVTPSFTLSQCRYVLHQISVVAFLADNLKWANKQRQQLLRITFASGFPCHKYQFTCSKWAGFAISAIIQPFALCLRRQNELPG